MLCVVPADDGRWKWKRRGTSRSRWGAKGSTRPKRHMCRNLGQLQAHTDTTHPYRRPQHRPSLFHPTLTNQPISLPHSGAMAKSEAAAKTPRTLTLWKRQKLKKKNERRNRGKRTRWWRCGELDAMLKGGGGGGKGAQPQSQKGAGPHCIIII